VEPDAGLTPPEAVSDEYEVLVGGLPPGTWRVDPHSSQVNFRARTLLLLPVNGFFERFGGELRVDGEGNTSGSLVIETGSLRTGIDRRDHDLRGADFFLAEQFPEMTFTILSLTAGRHDLELTGELSIRGGSLPLTFPLTAIAHGDHLHLEGRVVLDLGTTGLGWAKPGIVARTARAAVALTLQPAS
jgi:polyisoprenoid-binding protein YceI